MRMLRISAIRINNAMTVAMGCDAKNSMMSMIVTRQVAAQHADWGPECPGPRAFSGGARGTNHRILSNLLEQEGRLRDRM